MATTSDAAEVAAAEAVKAVARKWQWRGVGVARVGGGGGEDEQDAGEGSGRDKGNAGMMFQHTIQGVHVRRGTEQRLEKEKSSGHTGWHKLLLVPDGSGRCRRRVHEAAPPRLCTLI